VTAMVPAGVAAFLSAAVAADAADRPWQARALCAEVDPDLWFPEKGGSTAPAKALCHQCPVMQTCRSEALANDERHGVWGGLSERERRRIVGPRRPAPAPGIRREVAAA